MKKFLSILLICTLAIAETVISPNMNLTVPVVGTTPGPQWANDINSCMTTIDQHDHTPGHGVPISSSALSITADLPLSNNSLTQVEAVIFQAQTSFATRQSVYVISPDLIYNDGNGNVIRITQSGSVSGASGTITGLPSGTASASYQSVGGTFQFQSATNTPANGSFASLSIAQQTTSPNIITLKSPNSLGASYNVTFPASVPSFASLLSMSTSGVLSTVPSSAPAYISLLTMNGSGTVSTVPYKAPTATEFVSGTVQTYTVPTNPAPLYLKIRMVGGGGGGGCSGTTSGGIASTNGGDSTFKTSGDVAILTANGGVGGTRNGVGASGGSASVVAPASQTVVVAGGYGGASVTQGGTISNASPILAGGGGGVSPFGGGSAGGYGKSDNTPQVGGNGISNSGSGGGGGSAPQISGLQSGDGGGAGGYLEAFISSPSTTYHYTVGSGGTGQNSGANGAAGGNGGSGLIIIEEYYQ